MASGAQGARGPGGRQGQQWGGPEGPAGAQRHGAPALPGWGDRGLGWEAGRRKTGGPPGPLPKARWGPGCEAPPGRLGPLLWPHPPPVATAATRLAATGGPALAARLLWGPSGRAGRLCGHPVLLAGTGRWRWAVSPQGVGARHRHVLKLVEQQREGPILGAFAATHDGLGGPGLDGGDAGRVHQGLGPPSRLLDQALPLAGQPRELLLVLVEARVHAVLEVGWRGDLYSLLLLPKHGAEALSTTRAQTWAPISRPGVMLAGLEVPSGR